MVETEAEFLVEVTNRTKADVKVGIFVLLHSALNISFSLGRYADR